MTGRKNRTLQVPPVVPYKALEKFLRLCMGQWEVLAVPDFSVLSWRQHPILYNSDKKAKSDGCKIEDMRSRL